ncbi:helix-turn-helix domain-containing protein [Dictyobacter arantiisoli]|uniref:helix-turn-helix domain-containing protein n=1 Tax=Dictyobacter arantiisoli TaxID=2014874 RepID=UPI00155B3D43|nr:helix-turn-helix transcriptional regulator [Dictyobacter arantiisoli]
MEQQKPLKKRTFPEQLKYQRELRGWSQAKMAEEIGATPNRISSWERGIALPGAYLREQLCLRLDMNAQELGLLAMIEEDLSAASESVSSVQQQMLAPPIDIPDPSEVSQKQLSDRASASHSVGVKRISRLRAILTVVIVLLVSLLIIVWSGPLNAIFNPNATNPYPPHSGQLILNDTLQNQNNTENWQEGTNSQQASCIFEAQGYVAFQPHAGYFHACIAQKTDYTNFTYEVAMTIEQGEFGGIIFRSENSVDSHYYIFRIHTDGSYWLYRFVDSNIEHAILLQHSTTQVFNTGLGKGNVIAVSAQSSTLTFYINRQQVCALQDAAYTHGQIGVFAGSLEQAPSQAIFKDAKVWTR